MWLRLSLAAAFALAFVVDHFGSMAVEVMRCPLQSI